MVNILSLAEAFARGKVEMDAFKDAYRQGRQERQTRKTVFADQAKLSGLYGALMSAEGPRSLQEQQYIDRLNSLQGHIANTIEGGNYTTAQQLQEQFMQGLRGLQQMRGMEAIQRGDLGAIEMLDPNYRVEEKDGLVAIKSGGKTAFEGTSEEAREYAIRMFSPEAAQEYSQRLKSQREAEEEFGRKRQLEAMKQLGMEQRNISDIIARTGLQREKLGMEAREKDLERQMASRQWESDILSQGPEEGMVYMNPITGERYQAAEGLDGELGLFTIPAGTESAYPDFQQKPLSELKEEKKQEEIRKEEERKKRIALNKKNLDTARNLAIQRLLGKTTQ